MCRVDHAALQVLSSGRRDAEAAWSHMARLAPFVREETCDQTLGVGDYGNAFNNLSVHSFAPGTLPAAKDDFWLRPFSAPPADAEVIGRLIDVAGAP
eukprot:1152184-Prymnesium_polylepis.3